MNPRAFRILLLICSCMVAAAATATAQTQASVASYGSPCPPGNPSLVVQGLPQLGTMFTASASWGGVPASGGGLVAGLVLGGAPTNVAIHHPILAWGAGCPLLASNDAFVPMPPWSASLTIPNQPSLVGFSFYLQAVAIMVLCGYGPCSYGLTVTQGMQCTVGY